MSGSTVVRHGSHRGMSVTAAVMLVVMSTFGSLWVSSAKAADPDAKELAPATAPDGHPVAPAVLTHSTWQTGDVAVTVDVGGRNDIQWLSPDGSINKTIDISQDTILQSAVGTAFGPGGVLYVTNFSGTTLWEIGDTGNVGAEIKGDFVNPESATVDHKGHLFVGQSGGLPGQTIVPVIHKLDLAGNQLAEWTVARDTRGTDWVSLESDDCTLLYTSEGTTIKRFNVCTGVQLSNFASGLPNTAYSVHMLGDGSVLVADTSSILRLNGAGQIVQTYTAPGENQWFSLDVDPSGTAFWAGTANNHNLYKIAISSGQILLNLNMGNPAIGISTFNANQFGFAGPPAPQTNGGGTNPNGVSTTDNAAEPVNTATGNYTKEVNDFQLPGRGLSLDFVRSYNSLDQSVGTMGPGWTNAYAAHLVVNGDGSVLFYAEDGGRYLYTPNGSGGFTTPPAARSTLSVVSGGYQLKRLDQVRYVFDAAGVLQTEVDRNGNVLTFTNVGGRLTQITDAVGRIVSLGYDANGRLATLNGPPSRQVSYGYNGLGQLSSVIDVRGGTTNYTYDAAGRLATVVDQNNHTLVTNTYGADGRVATQLDALQHPTTFAWDPSTQTSTMTDARGGVWTDVYSSNVLVEKIDPLGDTSTYGYDTSLNALTTTDPRGNTTASTFDANGNLLSRGGPGGGFVRHTYNALNDPLTTTDGRGNTSTFTYDAAGNLKTVTGPAPASPLTTYNYDPAGTGLVFSMVDPRTKTTLYGYDAQANRNRITTPLGNVTTKTFDTAGRMLTEVEPRGNVIGADPAMYTTTFTYDAAGNVLTATDPLNHTTTTVYDPAGNRTSVTDANTHAITYAYDAGNRLLTVTDPRLKTTSYTYDEVGNQLTRTDANSHTTTYGYDLARRRISETKPLTRLWTYAYDPSGNRIQVVDAIGNSTPQTGDGTTTFTYDGVNRVAGTTYSDGTPAVTYVYDASGNRTQMTDPTVTTYTYDVLNRLTRSVRSPSQQMDFTYDAAGHVLTRTPLGGTPVTYTYDNDGRMLTEVATAQTTTFGYDAAGNATSTTLPSGNGYVETRIYDNAGRLTEVKNQKGATVLSKATYTLDPVGNRSTIVTTTGTTTLTYDASDRLTQTCYTTACTGSDNFRRYTYDDVGNRLTEVAVAGTTTSTYDALDQLVSSVGPGGTTNYAFNLDGDQTTAGTQTFTFDLANRLKTMTASGTTTTYTYDGDGRRVQASTGAQANKNTKFVWDINRPIPQLVRELDGSNSLQREYQYGIDLIAMQSGGSTYYFQHDGLGSVVNLTSSTGVTQWTYEYHPYGVGRTTTKNNTKAPANLIQFTGQYLDPTGLYHLRARQYTPSTGRFLVPDLLPGSTVAPGVATYVYALGNPTNLVDPLGLESKAAGTTVERCTYSPGERIVRFLSGTFVTGAGVGLIAFGGLAAFLGVGEIAAAGAETVITDGLAGPVAVIQVSGGIDLILVYGGGSIVAGGGLVVAGGDVVGTAFC